MKIQIKLIAAVLPVVFAISTAKSQDKYFTKEGHVTFYSSTPLEKFDGQNTTAVSVVDAATGNLELAVLVKAFQFEKDLMQKHFNENYMESDIFPKSSFKGNIINIKEVDFKKDGIYKVKIAGKLTMHGVTKDVNTEAKMEVKGEKITAKSEFSILLSDYNIDVPKLVKDQISNEIKIEVNNVYLPLKPVN